MKRSFFANLLLLLLILAVFSLGVSLFDRYVIPNFQEEITELSDYDLQNF